MKYNADNIESVKINDLQDFKIIFVGSSNRRPSHKLFKNQPNCSGYNINQYLKRGMTVHEYQCAIKENFFTDDPQFSLIKHLKYDILQGYLELTNES